MPHDITQEGRSEVGVPCCIPGRGVGIEVFLLHPKQKGLEGVSPAAPWAVRSWDQDAPDPCYRMTWWHLPPAWDRPRG